jgi:hypothetical protein
MKISPEVFKFHLLRAFTGLKVRKYRRKIEQEYCYNVSIGKKNYIVSVNDLSLLLTQSFNFLFTEDEEGELIYQLDSKLFVTPYKRIRIGFRYFYAPDDAFSNLTFLEFIKISTLWDEFCTTKDEEILNAIFSVLYRIKNKSAKEIETTGDKREKFNDFVIEKNAKHFRKLNDIKKQVLMFYFTGSLNYLSIRFPNALSKGTSNVRIDVFDQYMNITGALAKDDPTKEDDVLAQPLYRILKNLENTIINSKKVKK